LCGTPAMLGGRRLVVRIKSKQQVIQRASRSMDLIINFLISIVTLGGALNWSTVAQHLFSIDILQGVILTVIIAVVSQLAGSIIGLLLYFARRSRVGPLRSFVSGYVWLFRGTPLLVQILFINELTPLFRLTRPLNNLHLFLHLGFR